MNMKQWMILAASVTLCAMSCLARDDKGAEPGAMGRPRPGATETSDVDPQWLGGNKSAIKEIGLSDEQSEAVKKLRIDMRRELIDVEADKERAALAQAELLSKEKPDEAAVMQAVDNVFAMQSKIGRIRMKYLLKMREILTPEQREKARGIMRQKRPMTGQRGDRSKKGHENHKKAVEKEVPPPPPPSQAGKDDNDDEDEAK